MVRRLVEQEQVRRPHEDPCQGDALALPHGQLADAPVHVVDSQARQDGPGFAFDLPSEVPVHFLLDLQEAPPDPGVLGMGRRIIQGLPVPPQQGHHGRIAPENLFQDRRLRIVGRVLGQVLDDACAVGRDLARFSRLAVPAAVQFGHMAQQGRFARAVDAEDADFIPCFDMKRHMLEQDALAVAMRQVLYGKKQHIFTPSDFFPGPRPGLPAGYREPPRRRSRPP